MKIKYLIILYTAGIILLMALNSRAVWKDTFPATDMARLNADYKQIVTALDSGEDKKKLEDSYDCRIYLRTDGDYAGSIVTVLQDGNVQMDYMKGDLLLGKIVFSGQKDKFLQSGMQLQRRMIFMCAGLLLAGYILIGILYYSYIRPFRTLQQFAADVAKGNMEVPLKIQKGNYFGAFTESFDLMREELKKAREKEYQANISKKELVAALSHDMKTPVAAIKATCEVLKLKLLKSDLLGKVEIIEQKSDMIEQLINNMFHATLEELENLAVEPAEQPSGLIVTMLEELQYYENIKIKNNIPECLIYMDKLRLKQVIDNIVNNSYKYAGTRIDVLFREESTGILVEFRDYGSGVAEEELPFVTEKYYRGSNGKEKSGAGLGLFLAKYFMEHMGGALECYSDGGFVVNLFLRKV